MLTRIEEATRLHALTKQLLDEHKALARIQASKPTTAAAGTKQSVDLTFQAVVIRRAEAALHAACVDAGIADLRPAEYYEPQSIHLSGFHEHRFVPAQPQALQKSARSQSPKGGGDAD